MSDARAGQPAQPGDLVDVAALVTAYYTRRARPGRAVAAGRRSAPPGTAGPASTPPSTRRTSWPPRRPSASTGPAQGYDGPLFIGRDTHALSEPAWATALEVLAANDVTVLVDAADRYTPTPAVSHAILAANRGKTSGLADGIVVTPSHNPPRDGGFKYNPPNGGPADTDATGWIAGRANDLLRGRAERRPPGAARPGPRRRRARTTSSAPTSTTCRTSSTSTRSARPASGSAPTRWAARASTTGRPSPSGTGSTSPWSTRSSTPPGGS